ncbi:MAG: TetR/AcrR family transcriptional regulator [Lachnospiraceae bacterium]|nr:TetR/AcrR family transcriptional regulator [Lachnospiraceae bacterium]
MPPKAKFSKEEIIAAALQIVQENGIEAVTARELGARLGSSARPIFTVFDNMEEVLAGVEDMARELYRQYVERGLTQTPAFRGVGLAYIQFAIQEPKLFQLLFMSEKSGANDVAHVLALIDQNYEVILKSVQDSYGLDRENADRLYRHLWIYSHGIATLCATKVCRFTPQDIGGMLTEVFTGLFIKIKREEKDDSGK